MIRLRLFELAKAMRPAPSEDDAGGRARAGFVCLERVANDHALVLADEQLERRRALVTTDAMHDGAGRRETPHLPRLGPGTVEPRPAGLIKTDHRLLHHVLGETGDRDLQPLRDDVELIPQRLRRDDQAVLRHDPRLPREREMVEVLVEDDLDRDLERVAPAVDRSEEHTSELQSRENLVCRLLLEKKIAILSRRRNT